MVPTVGSRSVRLKNRRTWYSNHKVNEVVQKSMDAARNRKCPQVFSVCSVSHLLPSFSVRRDCLCAVLVPATLIRAKISSTCYGCHLQDQFFQKRKARNTRRQRAPQVAVQLSRKGKKCRTRTDGAWDGAHNLILTDINTLDIRQTREQRIRQSTLQAVLKSERANVKPGPRFHLGQFCTSYQKIQCAP